jgi:hypothetical protein
MNPAQGLVCRQCLVPVECSRQIGERCTDPNAPTRLAFGLLYECPRCHSQETDAYAITWAAVKAA